MSRARKPGDPPNRISRDITLRVTFDYDPTMSTDARREAMVAEVLRAIARGQRRGQGPGVTLVRIEPAHLFNPRGMFTLELEP